MCREWQQLRRSTTMRQWLHDAKSFAWLETFSGVEMIAKYLYENAKFQKLSSCMTKECLKLKYFHDNNNPDCEAFTKLLLLLRG
jgi:hypothetical protein